ncbi:MAG: type II toxin-antitoxin system YafQ family toxin [Deltaproteobacteria bacterium]|nr:type II toxin-antitoxin system YafQ family toxin [Deltaproteobacteria bacterium]
MPAHAVCHAAQPCRACDGSSPSPSASDFVRDPGRRGKDLQKLEAVVRLLAAGEPLDAGFRDHPLRGDWADCRDCHVEPDWVLIYTADDTTLRLERTGTHSDLFG